MPLNNEQNCREISEYTMSVCKKTACLRSEKFSDVNPACLKVLVHVKIIQFQDMLNESERHWDASSRPERKYFHMFAGIKFNKLVPRSLLLRRSVSS